MFTPIPKLMLYYTKIQAININMLLKETYRFAAFNTS